MSIAKQYQPQKIEMQIQNNWKKEKAFEVTEDKSKEKFYCLDMFPYPSGRIHIGHVRNYMISEIIARQQRALGKNVLHPMGWDAFGLPAENAAIKHGIPADQWTYEHIDFMKKQLKQLGFSYDWSRELITCKPEYYRWEQWLFIKMFEKGLAYRKSAVVNWDPVDQTVLANEQVIDGRGWRSNALIERREIPQWFFKITAYADELIDDLKLLGGWSEAVRVMQENWIGRSEGVEVKFSVKNSDFPLSVYTTRLDTFFGITYLAVASQHPIAKESAKNNSEIQKFIEDCSHIKVAEAELETMEKKGLDTGFKAIHPITHELVPIWVTNYVLMDYGSGAVMGVPAHDDRDFAFAKKYQLPIQDVIQKNKNEETNVQENAFTEKGVLVHSGDFSGLSSDEAIQKIADHLISLGLGERKVNYRLRDWSISRQRYWGAPIPIVYCDHCGTVPVAMKDLPVTLPEKVEFKGVTSPLTTMPEFYETTCPKCGKKARRETDTFDNFMESSWYFARYACPDQNQKVFDDRTNYWLPVDQYVGGVEHAVMHLLYARFFHKVMRDLGLVKCDEPFTRLLNQGMVLMQGAKMSKSKGNTVDTEDLVNTYGADTVRFFMIFAAPPEQSLEWSPTGVEGSYRFLKRLWTLAEERQNDILDLNKNKRPELKWDELNTHQKEVRKEIYLLLQQANYDMERQQFNTVASACMKILNFLYDLQATLATDTTDITKRLIHDGLSVLLRLLNPICPHVTEYLWKELQYGKDLTSMTWPKPIEIPMDSMMVTLPIQINGKMRAHVEVPAKANNALVEKMVLTNEAVQKYLNGQKIKKIIVVPNRIVNIVV